MNRYRAAQVRLVSMILEERQGIDAELVGRMVSILGGKATTLHRLYTAQCNRPLAEHDVETMRRTEDDVAVIIGNLGPGFGLAINDDPRGAPLRIILPSKRSDNMGGEGMDVPCFATHG
jgi:hypothetical protein